MDHYEQAGLRTCERWEPARQQFLAALDLRRDEDLAPKRGAVRPIEDIFLVSLSGLVASTYEGSADCADLFDRTEDLKRFRALKDAYSLRQFADARRFLDPADSLRAAFAAEEAKFHADAGRPEIARTIARDLAAEARRRRRDDSPAIIELELKYLDCPPKAACTPEAHKRIGELAAAALQFGARRRPEPYELYAYPFLAERFRSIDRGAWLSVADGVYARAVALRSRLFGIADAGAAAALHYEFRRTTPEYAARAIEPARVVVSATRARIAMRGAAIEANADVTDIRTRANRGFRALADAAWAAGGDRETGGGPLAAEAYVALQESLAGTVSRALALSAAQRAADQRGVGGLAHQRMDLIYAWAQLDAEFVRSAAKGAAGAEALRRRRDQAARDVADVERRLRATYPGYFDDLNTESLDIRATQALLGPDEAVLLVAPSDIGGAHVIAVSRDRFAWRRSGSQNIGSMTDHLLWLSGADVKVSRATERRWTEQAGPGLPFDRKLAFALYSELVAPVGDVLQGKGHVFVVSGGFLSRLPFGILVAAAPQGDDRDPAALRATAWFADAHALAVIPSVRSLQRLRKPAEGRATPEGADPFAGFGDPALDGQATSRGGRPASGPAADAVFLRDANNLPTGTADISALRRLSRLPGTAVELENMRRLMHAPPTALRLGDRATETAVKAADLSQVRVIAFATHGLLAGELRGGSEPGLVMTPPKVATALDDGLLVASEVATLRLGADWVILSACNTAAGDASESLGLSGLARAFFQAGARSLLVSHWPVRDDVASVITVDTIRLQQETPGLSRAEALQRAMKRIRDDPSADKDGDTWAHPNAWAAFSLVGDGAEASPGREVTKTVGGPSAALEQPQSAQVRMETGAASGSACRLACQAKPVV